MQRAWHYIVTCGLSVLPILPHYLKKTRGSKRKITEHRMYILIFLQLFFPERFSFKREFNEIPLMCIGLCESKLCLVRFWWYSHISLGMSESHLSMSYGARPKKHSIMVRTTKNEFSVRYNERILRKWSFLNGRNKPKTAMEENCRERQDYTSCSAY
jgi:hypothetical protein